MPQQKSSGLRAFPEAAMPTARDRPVTRCGGVVQSRERPATYSRILTQMLFFTTKNPARKLGGSRLHNHTNFSGRLLGWGLLFQPPSTPSAYCQQKHAYMLNGEGRFTLSRYYRHGVTTSRRTEYSATPILFNIKQKPPYCKGEVGGCGLGKG